MKYLNNPKFFNNKRRRILIESNFYFDNKNNFV